MWQGFAFTVSYIRDEGFGLSHSLYGSHAQKPVVNAFLSKTTVTRVCTVRPSDGRGFLGGPGEGQEKEVFGVD